MPALEDITNDNEGIGATLAASTGEGGSVSHLSLPVSLSLWCLHPAVAMRELSRYAHSVILTSGTLSPLDSFSSELGTEFKVSFVVFFKAKIRSVPSVIVKRLRFLLEVSPQS